MPKRVMTMRLSDHLNEKQRKHLDKFKQQPNKKKKKKPEKIDWNELMGTNRDIFRRGKGGAIRRK